jgi:hypothetical protein
VTKKQIDRKVTIVHISFHVRAERHLTADSLLYRPNLTYLEICLSIVRSFMLMDEGVQILRMFENRMFT